MRAASSYWYIYVYLGCCDLKTEKTVGYWCTVQLVTGCEVWRFGAVWPITELHSRAFPLEDPKVTVKLIWGLGTTKNAQRLVLKRHQKSNHEIYSEL